MDIVLKMILGLVLSILLVSVSASDVLLRKSIVYDKKTPDVFYCPQHKPIGKDKMIVQAKPLKKLCEYGSNSLPEDYKSDCYNNVDETEFACKEKYRIMMRLHPPGSDTPYNEKRLKKFNTSPKEAKIQKKST